MKMASAFVVATAFCLALAPCAVTASSVSPSQQVINMLTEMKAKGEKMMDQEQKTFAAYHEWADDRSKDLALEIKTLTSKIEELTAFASKADSDVAELGRAIAQLDAEINQLEGQKQAATEERAEQHKEYLKVSADYGESVDALGRAIRTVSAQDYDRAQAEMLLQKMAITVPGMPRVLAAFLQEKGRTSLRGDGAPEVAAYEFQSGGILALLEKLSQKFKGELADVEEDEANQAHEFSLVELHLSNTIKQDTSDRDEKAVAKGERAAASAKAKGELAETKADKAASAKLKADTESTYAIKAAQFEENQKVRAAELEAIGKAVEILSSPEVAGSYGKHISFTQQARGAVVSLLQMGRRHTRMSVRKQAALSLRKRAVALHSKTLLAAASQVSANPSFTKVIGMVEDLLERLKQEAAAEADHKAWCDKELKANKLKRNKKTARANKLTAEIEGLDASIAEMAATIAKLAQEQSDLSAAMSEATKLRQEEKAENTATIADAAAGAKATKQALVVLKEFYSSQAALIQQKQVPAMEAYKGMQSAKGGVVGMLEVIESDFARLKADTETSESTAATEYDRFMEESTASKKQKHEEEFKLSLEKDQSEYEKSRTEKSLASVNEELSRANQYFGELKPSCIQVHVSYEERAAKRKEEIEALKQAYKILDQKSAE